MNRAGLGAVALACLLLSAGCAGVQTGAESGDSTVTTSAGDRTTEATVVPRASYPEPPANLSGDAVTSVAVDYDAARLQNRLREEHDVTYFELGYQRPANATVLNRSDGGVAVAVNATYSYAYDDVAADFVPVCSRYHVDRTAVRYLGPCGD